MVADPAFTPLTCGCVVEKVDPAPMNTPEVTVAIEVLLLVSVTVTPPGGAADGNDTATVAD
jgi:hypothetical protein